MGDFDQVLARIHNQLETLKKSFRDRRSEIERVIAPARAHSDTNDEDADSDEDRKKVPKQ